MTRGEIFFDLMFLISGGLVFYSYVIFPALISFLAKGKILRPNQSDQFTPEVSVIISVFNEERVIREKIESILTSDYPLEKIKILIGSDSSTDNTAGIINTISNPGVEFYDYKIRRGKPAVVNELVQHSKSEIIILTDANVFFEAGTIKELVKHFNDEKTGLVGANILNVGMRRDGISIQEKSYIQRENLIKYREGILWGCMMGPFGGCYALRKNLYEIVPPGFLVDDFYISMKIIEQKYKCIIELSAICYEDVSNDVKQEYKRKARISAGNFQNLKKFFHFVWKPFTPAGFCFVSHKVIRWLTPFFIILNLTALSQMSRHDLFFRILFFSEILLLLSPLTDWLFKKAGIHLRVLRFVSYFSLMNLALLKGFFRFAGGIKSGVWEPTGRNERS